MYTRIWKVTCEKEGFKFLIFIEATEAELVSYMSMELSSYTYKTYSGATEEEVAAAKLLGMHIYIV